MSVEEVIRAADSEYKYMTDTNNLKNGRFYLEWLVFLVKLPFSGDDVFYI